MAANLIIIALVTAAAWWLSGYDTRVTGEDETADLIRRATRCGITMVLISLAAFGKLWFVRVSIFWTLGIFWASCGAEFFSRQFHNLLDPEDKRLFDPKQTERHMDSLAQLVRERRVAEALDLCKKLEESREASPLTLEATLYRLYQETLESIPTEDSLAEPRSFCERRQFEQAESQLKQILAGQPKNWAAMLLLMRMYTENLSHPDKALAMLQPTNKPALPAAFVKYARQSIGEWSRAGTGQRPESFSTHDSATSSPSENGAAETSVDELLKLGQLTTAIEYLEKEAAEQPQNFELWLKLAEAYAVYCADFNRAGKMIRTMELSSKFTSQEIEVAKAKLREWQAARRS